MQHPHKILLLSTLTLILSLLTACGGGGGGSTPVDTGRTYVISDPSFDTTITIKSSTFSAAHQGGPGYTYSGTVASQPLGLLELTLTTSDDPADVGMLPKVFYAREIPDAMLMLTDTTTFTGNGYQNAQLATALGGDCATVMAGTDYQGIILQAPAADRVADDFWLTASTAAGAAGLDLTLQPYKLTDNFQSIPATAPVTLADLSCAGSPSMSNVGGDLVNVTPSGLIMVTTSTLKALLVPVATGLVSTDVSALGRAFSGISVIPDAGTDTNFGTGDDFMRVQFMLLNGDYHSYSGNLDTLSGEPITDIPNAGTDPTQAGQIALKQSAGNPVPDGLFDASGVPDKTASQGRFITHVMPNGSHLMLGYAEEIGATLPNHWIGFISAEFLAPPTLPAQVTTGNTYVLDIKEGVQNQVTLNIDTALGTFMGIGDTGQIFWGSANTLASGFIKMIASGTSNPKDRGTAPVLYASEFPDSIINIFPADTYDAGQQGYLDNVAGFDPNGTCMSAGAAYNLMHAPDSQTFDQALEDAYGVGTAATGAVTGLDLTGILWSLGTDMTMLTGGGGTLPSLTCTAGRLLTNGTSAVLHMASGLAVLDATGTGDDVFVMLPQPASPLAASTLVANGKSYRGIAMRPIDLGGGNWGTVGQFITATANGSTITASGYDDVEAGTLLVGQDGIISLGQSGSASNGMFDASTLTVPGPVMVNLRVMAYLDTSSGKNKHLVVGMFQADTNGDLDVLDPKDYIFVALIER